MSIATEISRIQAATNDIKTAIVDKGVTIPEDSKIDTLANYVTSIPTGGGGEVLGGFEEIDFPTQLATGTLYTFTSNSGEIFFSTSTTTDNGIWWLDRVNKEIIQVHNVGYSYYGWYEDSSGNIFISSATSYSGILKWDSINKVFVKVCPYATFLMNYWFEDSLGNVFVSSNTANVTGIFHWNSETELFDKVYNTSYRWQYGFEDSQGNVFISGSLTATVGILKWDSDSNMLVQVYSTSYDWKNWHGGSGNTFVTSSIANTGILYWDSTNNEFKQAYTTGSMWNYWFEDSQGNVFASDSASNIGILHWKADTGLFVKVHSAQGWVNWFESSSGDVFVTNGTTIIRWNGTGAFVSAYGTTGGDWKFWYESSQGYVFLGSGSSSYLGILCWYPDSNIFQRVYTAGYNWASWFEDSNGNLYVSGSTVLRMSNDKFGFTSVKSSGIGNVWFEDSQGNIFAATTSTSSHIFKWNSTTSQFDDIYATNGIWSYWFEDDNGNVFVRTPTSANKLKYDDLLGTFTPYGGYGVTEYGNKYRITTGSPTVIYKDLQYLILNNVYNSVVSNGYYASCPSTNKLNLLYLT